MKKGWDYEARTGEGVYMINLQSEYVISSLMLIFYLTSIYKIKQNHA